MKSPMRTLLLPLIILSFQLFFPSVASSEQSEIKREYNLFFSWEDAFKTYDYKTPSAMVGFDKTWGFYYTDYMIPSFSLRAASDLAYFGQFKMALLMGISFDWALTKLRPSTRIYMGSGFERRRFIDGDNLSGLYYVMGLNQQFLFFNETKSAYLFGLYIEASPTSDLNGISLGLQLGQGDFNR